jgi:hypothetical protein
MSLMILAGTARAERSAQLTLGVQVVRSAVVRVAAEPVRGGGVRLDARVQGGDRGAGVVVAVEGAGEGAAVGVSAPVSVELAAQAAPRGKVVVTVLPDGRPPALRVQD